MPPAGLRAICLAIPLLWFATPVSAQIIPIKTIPIAQGDQFQLFPSNNLGMGSVSIALVDSLRDPFVNPATTVRLRGSRFFGSPTVYSLSGRAGGGRSLPVSVLARKANWYGGLGFVLQQVDPSRPPRSGFGVVDLAVPAPGVTPPLPPGDGFLPGTIPGPDQSAHGNKYAFGMVGRTYPEGNLSIGASALWTGLHALDGVDLLYAGSRRVAQSGHALDLRVGALKEWPGERGARTLEAIVVHNRFMATHDVLYADLFWDPNTQQFLESARTERNLDHTVTWGTQLQYSIPLGDPGWRLGWLAIVNRASHPKIPNYEIANVPGIPRDPGYTSAYNFGIGASKVLGPSTFGIDAVFEPIRSYTWADAPTALVTAAGDTIPAGGKTIENRFRFSNALVRIGVGRQFRLEGEGQSVTLQLGLMTRSIDYRLRQVDNVTLLQRAVRTRWLEYTPTWGFSLRFPEIEIRYSGRVTKGAGRPGGFGGFIAGFRDVALAGGTILAAPTGPLNLTDVNTSTHQLSVSLPLR
ncbi:MAG: hypothetical protein ACREMI_08820 [Gemmatimonadales bacterium]